MIAYEHVVYEKAAGHARIEVRDAEGRLVEP